MKPKLRILPEAESDLLEAYDWYGRQSVGLGSDSCAR
jgi:hypothetical protein